MMKKWIAALLCLCLLCSGCAKKEEAPAEVTPEEIRFTDDLGREVCLPSRPERVACLTASFADIYAAAGGVGDIVATTSATWTYFDLPFRSDIVDIGSSKNPDLERLIMAEPELVLGSCGTERNVELEQSLEKMGLPVAYFSVNDFADYLRMLKICTELTACEEKYEENGLAVERQVRAALERVDGSAPTVLYIRATGSSCKVKGSEGSVLGEMLAALDCRNIADGGLLEQLSMEAILEAEPDYIFAVLQSADPADAEAVLERTLLQNPAWSSLRAVQEGRFHIMDANLYNMKPNGRWGEAYEKLANILYPAA